MVGDVREYIAPSIVNLVDNITVSVFGPECCGIELEVASNATLGAGTWTANLLIFVPLITAEPLVVSQFFWYNGGTVNGNTDVGIYTEDGTTKLVSTTSTATMPL